MFCLVITVSLLLVKLVVTYHRFNQYGSLVRLLLRIHRVSFHL